MASPGGQGVMTISKRELLQELVVPAAKTNTYLIELTPLSYPFLKTVMGSFERYRYKRLAFFYKPAVGTTVGGLVAMGIDWSFSYTTAKTRAAIAALSPSHSFSVWTDTESKKMVLEQSRLNSRAWYADNGEKTDKSPGQLVVAITSDPGTVGEIWVDYTVDFMGTKA